MRDVVTVSVETVDVLRAQRLELVEVEPGEPADLLLCQGHTECIAGRLQMNLADGNQELLGREPPAGIHDDVAGPAGSGVHDEAINSAEFLSLIVSNLHLIEIECLVVERRCGDVPQPRLGVIHEASSRWRACTNTASKKNAGHT